MTAIKLPSGTEAIPPGLMPSAWYVKRLSEMGFAAHTDFDIDYLATTAVLERGSPGEDNWGTYGVAVESARERGSLSRPHRAALHRLYEVALAERETPGSMLKPLSIRDAARLECHTEGQANILRLPLIDAPEGMDAH